MIGLCRGLVRKAFVQRARHHDYWQYWKEHPRFGMLPRKEVDSQLHPVSCRYYQLLDACPLRMSGDGT